MLQACLNGARSPHEHHHLPVRPEDLAQAAAASTVAGATDIHLHPKTAYGTDSVDPHVVATTLRAVRAACPTVPIGISTGGGAYPDPAERIAAIRAWTVLPDRASINWHENGADDIARALHERGVGIEAALSSGTDADQHFVGSPLRNRVLRVLVHVTDPTARAATTAQSFLARLPKATTPILLHGKAAGAWPVLSYASSSGLDTRIGLEDTLQLPDGRIPEGNADLVTAAVARMTR